MNKTIIIVVALVAVVGIVGGGIWFMNRQSTPSTTQTTDDNSMDMTNMQMDTTPETTNTTPVAATGNVKTFVVEGNNFKFAPTTMKVKKGDTVKITFKNTGGNHDFVIDEFDVATNQIGDGEEEEVEFVADKAGTFEYYCSVGNHRAMGMKGTLTVE